EVPSGGSFHPAPGLLVDYTPTCATVQPAQSTSDADGRVTTTVTPGPGCNTVKVDLTARAAAGDPPLVTKTVTAMTEGPQIQLFDRESYVYLIANGEARREGEDTISTDDTYYQTDNADPRVFQEYEHGQGTFGNFAPEDHSSKSFTLDVTTGS